MKKTLLFLLLSIAAGSCVKSPTQPSGQFVPAASIVYVVNQGIYGQGNSTLTAYYPDSNKAVTDVFNIVNKRSLGDTGNDIAIYNGKAYIVVNNSDKIEVIDASSALSTNTIYFRSGTSPYRIAIDPDDNLGFVSDLNTNSVSIINLNTNSLMADTILVGSNPYGITYTSGKVFVANSGYGSGNTVSVIDAASKALIKTVTVGNGPTEVEPDGNGNVWVVCPGNTGDIGKIYLINASTLAVTDSINTGLGLPSFYGQSLAIDPQHDAAYLIADSSVIKLDVKSQQVASSNFIDGTFFCMSVDLSTGDIFVAGAKNYTTDGEAYLYSPAGTSTGKSFTTGISPWAIAFER